MILNSIGKHLYSKYHNSSFSIYKLQFVIGDGIYTTNKTLKDLP